MKKRILLFTSSIVLFSTLIMSYEDGPAHMNMNFSGGPGSAMNCSNAGCHTGSSVASATSIAIEVRKLSTGITGPIVTTYNPDTTYIIRIVGANTATSLTRFGFNFQALKASQTTVSVGSYSGLPTNVDTASAGGRTIVEHTNGLNTTSGQFVTVFNWKAPAAGTGTVNMYGIINAVNNDGNASGADKVSAPINIALTEVNPTSISELAAGVEINTYPNPVGAVLNLDMKNAENGSYTINIYDGTGKMVASKVAMADGTYHTSFSTAAWATGLYHIQIKKDGAQRTMTILKQ